MATATPAAASDKDPLASHKAFIYEPLDLSQPTIRVLQILPGRSTDPIMCTLKQVRREEDGYVCLSYMWGDDSNCRSILVNCRRLQVRANLYAFLRLARKLKIRDWLWIDAISINQSASDAKERNHQVQQMAEIYRAAKHVLVYPGHIDATVATAAKLAWRLNQPWESWSSYHMKVLRRCSHAWNEWIYRFNKMELEATSRLPYWERTWIIQELLLAKKCFLVSIDGLIPWRQFRTLFYDRLRFWRDPMSSFHTMIIRNSGQNADRGNYYLTLFEQIEAFLYTKCSDPRDRVYALLSLSAFIGTLKVDYGRSRSTLLLDVIQAHNLYQEQAEYLHSLISCLLEALEVSLSCWCLACVGPKNQLSGSEIGAVNINVVYLQAYASEACDGKHKYRGLECDYCGQKLKEEYRYNDIHNPLGVATDIILHRVSHDSAVCIILPATRSTRSDSESDVEFFIRHSAEREAKNSQTLSQTLSTLDSTHVKSRQPLG